MLTLEPKLSILDETDSGLDIDALKIVAKGVNDYRNDQRSFIAITHYQRLLDYMKPDKVHVLIDGKIVRSGNMDLAHEIEQKGYSWLEKMINFEKQFSNLLDYNPTTDSRLRTLRTQAFERFIKTGLPTKKWEEWQFTDFSVLNKEKFRINQRY